MAELIVEKTYGSALYQAATDLHRENEIKEELFALRDIFDGEPEFLKFLEAPTISLGEKKEAINDTLSGKFSDEIIRFLFVLTEKGRIRKFRGICSAFEKIFDENSGFVPGVIESAYPLTDEQIEKFEKETGRLIRRNVKLKNNVDKSLIGGVRIFADGKMIDASVKSRVSAMMDTIKREEEGV